MSKKNKHLEIEASFDDIDETKIKKLIKENGGKLINKKRIMPIKRYYVPSRKGNYFIRIRDEGDKITMTIKEWKNKKDKYPIEREVIIDSIEEGDAILKFFGCKKLYDLEKIRETWEVCGCKEVVFDSYPGLPTYMEIDCHTLPQLKKAANMLGYNMGEASTLRINDKYKLMYGIDSRRPMGDLTFKDADKILGKHIKRNKNKFMKILKKQKRFIQTNKNNKNNKNTKNKIKTNKTNNKTNNNTRSNKNT